MEVLEWGALLGQLKFCLYVTQMLTSAGIPVLKRHQQEDEEGVQDQLPV